MFCPKRIILFFWKTESESMFKKSNWNFQRMKQRENLIKYDILFYEYNIGQKNSSSLI